MEMSKPAKIKTNRLVYAKPKNALEMIIMGVDIYLSDKVGEEKRREIARKHISKVYAELKNEEKGAFLFDVYQTELKHGVHGAYKRTGHLLGITGGRVAEIVERMKNRSANKVIVEDDDD